VLLARGSSGKCQAEVVLAAGVLVVEAAHVLVLLAQVRVEALALQLLWLDAFALLITFVSQTRRRARAAERANLVVYTGTRMSRAFFGRPTGHVVSLTVAATSCRAVLASAHHRRRISGVVVRSPL